MSLRRIWNWLYGNQESVNLPLLIHDLVKENYKLHKELELTNVALCRCSNALFNITKDYHHGDPLFWKNYTPPDN